MGLIAGCMSTIQRPRLSGRPTTSIVTVAAKSRYARCGRRLRHGFEACNLELYPQKTKIVYCSDSNRHGQHPNQQFDFLGYTFRPRSAMNRAGKLTVSFAPAVSVNAGVISPSSAGVKIPTPVKESVGGQPFGDRCESSFRGRPRRRFGRAMSVCRFNVSGIRCACSRSR